MFVRDKWRLYTVNNKHYIMRYEAYIMFMYDESGQTCFDNDMLKINSTYMKHTFEQYYNLF